MNRKRLTQLGIALILLVVIGLALHFGGSWAVETFKEMHGM